LDKEGRDIVKSILRVCRKEGKFAQAMENMWTIPIATNCPTRKYWPRERHRARKTSSLRK